MTVEDDLEDGDGSDSGGVIYKAQGPTLQVSSYDETLNIVKCAKNESKKSEFLPYDIEEIVMTCFDYSSLQNRYYIVDSLENLYNSFRDNRDIFWYEG